MARNVISDTQFSGASVPPQISSTHMMEQGLLPLALTISDSGSAALIASPVPAHEPEVTKQRRTATSKKTARASKAKPKPKLAKSKKSAKSKSQLPARVAKKTVNKSPAKRAPSAKSAVSVETISTLTPPIPLIKQFEITEIESIQCSCPMEIEHLGAPNDLGISAIASAALDANPPWDIEPANEAPADLTPLPRSASLQLYGKSSWIGSIGHWMRSNMVSLLSRRQKPVAINRPAPKKLRPREMVAELNRLAEENRALRRRLAQISDAR